MLHMFLCLDSMGVKEKEIIMCFESVIQKVLDHDLSGRPESANFYYYHVHCLTSNLFNKKNLCLTDL